MVKFLLLTISIALLLRLSLAPETSTMPVDQRIEIMKQRLRAEIELSKGNDNDRDAYAGSSYDEDGDSKDFVLHPIGPDYNPSKDRSYKTMRVSNASLSNRKRIKTTTCKGHKSRNELRAELNAQKTTKGGLYMLNPLDIFYRRQHNIAAFNHESSQRWVQCQDLITPFMAGIKKEPTPPKRILATDTLPKKLFELLNLDTAKFTKDDVFTVIFQISKLQIRLFQWDVMPIRILMNIFSKGQLHTFKNLKKGIKDLFARWRLTFDNITYLLQSTQIIRPPCIETSKFSGSTKSNKVSKLKDWTSSKTKATTCNTDDWTCEMK